jgi:GPH family glycoside/pentoside/hexuronide:cation symporter
VNQNPPTQGGVKAKFQRAEQRVGKVPFWTKFAQGFSALPGQHKEWAFNTLLLLYYSQVLGMSATLAAVVIAISLVFDAISDPMVGAFSDSFSSRLGRRHPLMLASIAPSCIAIFALFSPPQDLTNYYLAAWMLVCTVTLRISFSFFAVPWGAIGAELSTDYKERTIVIAYRMLIGGLGGVLFIFFITGDVFPDSDQYPNGFLNPNNYPLFALIIAGLMSLWMAFSTLSTMDQIKFLPQPTGVMPSFSLSDMLARIHEAIKNQNFRVLFVATMIAAVVIGTGQVFDSYMNAFFWGFGTSETRWFALSFLGMAFAIVTVAPLQKRFEKRDVMLIAIIMISVLQVLKVSLRFAGWLPENGDPLLLQILVVHACVMGYCYFLVLMMFASMMADIGDDQELRNGLRQEGIFSGGIAFSGKVTTGFGLIFGGLLLDLVIVFPTGLQPGEVAQDVLIRMAVIDGIIMPALNLIPFLLLLKYKLNREAVQNIQSQLNARQRSARAPN